MSIIHEALKKTQISREQAASDSNAVDAQQSENFWRIEERSKSRAEERQKAQIETAVASEFPWRLIGVGSLLGLFLVATIGATSVFHFHPQLKSISIFAKNTKPPTKDIIVAHNAPALAPIILSGPLVLMGTMVEGQHRIAVINDQTYQVGDSVDNKKITGISMDHVTLQQGQNIFILKARV